jgi:hypothetical protein
MNCCVARPTQTDDVSLTQAAGTDRRTYGGKRWQETAVNMIIETELKLENRIIPAGVCRKYFNRFVAESLTSCC